MMVKGFIFFRDGKMPFVIENYRMELFTDDSLLDDFCKEYNFKENYILHGQCFDIGIRGRKATFLVENSMGSTCYLRCYIINMFDKDEEYDSIGLQSPSLDEVFRYEYEYIDMVRAGINLAVEPKVVYKVPFGMNDQKYELEFRIGHDNRLGLLEDLDRKGELILPLHTNEIQECYDITNVLHKVIKKGSNFRSAPKIVDLLNEIRPDLPQTSAIDDFEGEVFVITCEDYTGPRRADRNFKNELPPEELKSRLNKVTEKIKQETPADEELKVLMITHKVLATQQGYEKLLDILNDGLRDKEDPFLLFFMETVEPIYHALNISDMQFCHIFIKGCADEDYTGFFQTAGYIEQNTTPVCDSEQYCIDNIFFTYVFIRHFFPPLSRLYQSESELIHFFESKFLDESEVIHSGAYTNLYAYPL